jgi:GxxExxY protein
MREMEKNRVTEAIIGAAIDVHKSLGPGLLESTYQACLAYELKERGLLAEEEKPLPVIYKNVKLDCGYRIDLFVENQVIVEIKAIEGLLPVHQAQLLSYMKLSGVSIGLLINFNVKLLKDGIRRMVI